MAILKSLLVTLGLNSAQYRSELEKTQKKTKKSYSDMAKSAASFAAKSAAAFASAVSAMTVANAKIIREQSNLARISQMTLAEYQKMSFAAKQYGVSVEQVADVSKDAIEKIGEHINAGSGGLQDFADAMNMSKEETLAWAKSVEGLSGQQIFQKMINDMEDVGLSQAQMSNALESLGNDVTKLIPLFADNGKELERLTKRYEEFNGQLSPSQIAEYRLAAENIDLLATSVGNLSAVATSGLAGFFGDLAKGVSAYVQQIEALGGAMATVDLFTGTSLRERQREVFAEYTELQEDLKKYEGVKYDDLPSINPFGLSKNEWFNLQVDYSRKKEELKELNDAIVEQQKRSNFDYTKQLPKKSTSTKSTHKTVFETETEGATQPSWGEMYGGTNTVDLAALKEYGELQDEVASIVDRVTAQNETLEEKYARESELLHENIDDYSQYIEAKIALDEEYEKAVLSNGIKVQQVMLQNQADNLSIMQQAASGLAQYAEEGSAVAKAAFLVGQGLAMSQVMVQAEVAKWTATQTAPDPATKAAMMSTIDMQKHVSLAMIAAQTGAGLAGMAHDGIDNVPKEGTWLLDKGERVVDSRTNSDLKNFLSGNGGGSSSKPVQVIVQGNIYGDNETKRIISTAAQQGYSMVASDAKTNGVIYKQMRR